MNYTVIQPSPTTVEKSFPKLMSFTNGSIILATSLENNGLINGFIVVSSHLELGTVVYAKSTNLIDFDGEVILKNS